MGKSKGMKKWEKHWEEQARKKRIIDRLPWGQWYGGPYEHYRKFYLDCPVCGAEDLLDVQQNGWKGTRTGFHCLNCDHWQNTYKCGYCDMEQFAKNFYGLLEFGPVCTHCVKTKDVGIRIGYKSKGRFYQLKK